MARDTYDPKVLIKDYSAPTGSPWAETNFSTDSATFPKQTAMGWAETNFSTDTATTKRELGFELAEDKW